MGFLYQHDGQRLRPEFTCPCGSKRAERVKVKRPDGSDYETEFARCYTCCAMFHWPHPVPPYVASVGASESYGTVSGSETGPQLSSEQYADIMSPDARAKRSRKRR